MKKVDYNNRKDKVEVLLENAIEAVKYPVLSTVQENLIKDLVKEIEERHGVKIKVDRVEELEEELEKNEMAIDKLNEEIKEYEK